MTTADTSLADGWRHLRAGLLTAVPPPHRQQLDDLVVTRLPAIQHASYADPLAAGRDRLRIGVTTATHLAHHTTDDVELLAAAVVLPFADPGLLGFRWLLTPGLPPRGEPLDWTAAMVLALTPPEGTRPGTLPSDNTSWRYVRQLLALPPLLRAAVIIERALAANPAAGAPRPSRFPCTPFSPDQMALLAAGVPVDLLPYPVPPPTSPPAVPPPLGSPADAIALVRQHQAMPFGSHRVWVDGDLGFVVEARELVYQVRWDVSPDQIHRLGPALTMPGDRENVVVRDPGWLVDRVTGQITTVDLSTQDLQERVRAWRTFPLPPGWRPGTRPPLPQGPATELAAMLPAPLFAAMEPAVRQATSRYTALLATDDWPDFVVTWWVAAHTVGLLTATGCTDPHLLTAALLAARGTAPTDTLIEDDSDLWHTPAGDQARAARPRDDQTHGAGATQRAQHLLTAPAPIRALAVANAWARARVETELFGITPTARWDELRTLSPLTHDLPALRQRTATV